MKRRFSPLSRSRQLAFAWAAFDQMVAIVERGFRPSGAGTQQTVTTPNQIASS